MKKIVLLAVLILVSDFVVFGQTSVKSKKTRIRKNVPKIAVKQTKTVVVKLEREKFDPTRDATKDLLDAIAQAQKSGKRIVLDVGGEWCGWCRKMDFYFLQNSDLAKLRDENFVWLKINFSEENENEAFLARYPRITGYPHLFVLEEDGTFLFSQETSELEQQYANLISSSPPKNRQEADNLAKQITYDREKLAEFLKRWSPKKNVQK